MKNIEIPSIPIEKLILNAGIQKKVLTYWKVPILLLKKTHKKRDSTKVAHEKFKATVFRKVCFELGTHNKNIAPIKGKHKV